MTNLTRYPMHIDDFRNKHVHFIGIGGISMSGLAEILLGRGFTVTGSDWHDSALLDKLRMMGATCHIGNRAGNEEGADLVVITTAVAHDNPELVSAKRAGIPVMERAELLGQLMAEAKVSVGVSGMHGKTTCTSMLATVLVLNRKNPTIHIGSELSLIGGTTCVGTQDLFVAEACEYNDSFLKFWPNIEVILNIDEDHLDYFKDLNDIIESFKEYIQKLKKDDHLVINGDDNNCIVAAKDCISNIVTFGLDKKNDFSAANISSDTKGCFAFDVMVKGEKACRCQLGAPGKHNIYNALASIATASLCGVSPIDSARALTTYVGAKRRFELAGETHRGSAVYHDYAHHPVEVKATLETAKLRTKGKLIAIFQPHTYTRTKALFNEFAQAFDACDHLILVDIYAAREKDPGDIHSEMLAEAIDCRHTLESCQYATCFEEAAQLALYLAKQNDMIITLGAGDIERMSGLLVFPF